MFKYMMIKDGEVKVLKAKSMVKVVRKELGHFDYQDSLFDEDFSICLMVKDLSCFECDLSLIYDSFNQESEFFFGTIIFTRLGEYNYSSLSDNDIQLIQNHLTRLDNGIFKLTDFLDTIH